MKRKRRLPSLTEYSNVLVRAALAEDIGAGDITTNAVVKGGSTGTAEIIAKEELVVAGLFIAEMTFKKLDRSAVFKPRCRDGETVKKGKVIATISGRLDALLIGERVALNFMQRLSGIATRTSEFAKKIKSPNTKLLDTRKTTPCLRLLEKYAVKTGGGANHRFGLFDSVLIKDNHIKAAGSVTAAIEAVRKKYKDGAPIEVEVTNLKETKEAVAAGADIIMLDNMDVPLIKKALAIIKGSAFVEASGNINLDNIGRVSATGVDFISVGGLTHSARAVDISMEVTICGKRPQRSR